MHELLKPPNGVENIADEFDKTLTLTLPKPDEIDESAEPDDDHHDEEDDDEDDFEFFVGGGEDPNSPVSAEEIFHNGQIRPIFPYSDEKPRNSDEATTSYSPPVRKLFVVPTQNDDVAEGPYSPEKSASPVPEMSRKSNSTGFSKLWRVRDLLVRSHSDGKDAFVFLTGKSEERIETKEKKKKEKKKEVKTTSYGEKKGKKSAYEVLYGKRDREKEKRMGKSYLPYRQELVGFFTNSSGGMSRNVHPY